MRPLRLALAMVLASLVTLGMAPARALAQSEDRIDQMVVQATVRPDGSVQVTERLDYRLAGVGRHGVVRELVLADSWGGASQVRHRIEDVAVSTSQGSAQFTAVPVRRDGQEVLQLRIGNKDDEVVGSREQVRIRYTMHGAVDRSGLGPREHGSQKPSTQEPGSQGHGAPRIRWTLVDHLPAIEHLQVQIAPTPTAPVECTTDVQVACAQGSGGAVVADRLPRNARVRLNLPAVAAQPAPGESEPAGTPATTIPVGFIARQGWWIAVLLALGGAIAGRVWAGRAARDEPASDNGSFGGQAEASADGSLAIPPVPIAEAAVLLTGRVGARHSLATLLDLAARGWVTITERDRGAQFRRTSGRGTGGLALHEQLLLDSLFATEPVFDLSGRTALGPTQRRFERSVLQQVAGRHWFAYRHWGIRTALATLWGLALLAIGVVAAGSLGAGAAGQDWGTWWPILAIGVAPVLGWQTHRFTGSPSGRRTAVAMGLVARLDRTWEQLRPGPASADVQERWSGWHLGLAARDLDSVQHWQSDRAPTWWTGPWRTDAVDDLLVLWMAACARQESRRQLQAARGTHSRVRGK